MRILARVLLSIAAVWLVYTLRLGRWAQFYPLVMVLAALFIFASSLRSTPVIERIARRFEKNGLDERGIRYCRKATVAWTVFLSIHALLTLASCFASREVWALYNGMIAYILIGAMFAGEFVVRKVVRNAG